MLSFSAIAIFVLSYIGNAPPRQFDLRLKEIKMTWGMQFPHLYFVVGTNSGDHKFLQENCVAVNSTTTIATERVPVPKMGTSVAHLNSTHTIKYRSRLRKTSFRQPQLPLEDRIEQFDCFVDRNGDVVNPLMAPGGSSYVIQVLVTMNCTGEYFGYGPTCRCQEAMRFYLTHLINRCRWFAFMDDDIYVRPYSLLSFLNTTDNMNAEKNQSVALVTSQNHRLLDLSNRWNRSAVNCAIRGIHEFTGSVAFFVNHRAMEKLSHAILACNTLTGLQEVWGGTHDTLIGMLFWMVAIPTWSYYRVMFHEEIVLGESTDSVFASFDGNQQFMFHKVSNRPVARDWPINIKPNGNESLDNLATMAVNQSFLRLRKHRLDTIAVKRTRRGDLKLFTTTWSMTDVANLLKDSYGEATHNPVTKEQQMLVGINGIRSLERQTGDGIHKTAFRRKISELQTKCHMFTHLDCSTPVR